MPNRILRDGILSSERINLLSSWASEVFYRRLMSIVDDYGRYYANASLVRAACYPLNLDKVSNADIEKWLADCAGAALVSTYEVDGKRYLQLRDFRQQERAKVSKYPQPPDTCKAYDMQMISTLTSSAHLDGGVVEDEVVREGNSLSLITLDVKEFVATKNLTPTKPSKSQPVAFARETWEAYSDAYESRHGTRPLVNAKVRSQVKLFLQRVPGAEAPNIAAFFVSSNKSIYVRDKHPVGYLLRDAETLRTEWVTGRQSTDTAARHADRTQAIGDVFRKLIQEEEQNVQSIT